MIYRICRALLRLLFTIFFRLETRGLENIPATGPVLLASNHISNFDPITVGIKVHRRVHYMAKAELFAFKPIGAFLRTIGAFPVKRGGVSKDAIKLAIQLLRDGHALGIFPEGTRNSEASAAKRGAAMIAIRSEATIVPVAIVGNYRLFSKLLVIYGPPISLAQVEAAEGQDQSEALTDAIMSNIRSMIKSA